MEIEDSLSCSQQPTSAPYLKPDYSLTARATTLQYRDSKNKAVAQHTADQKGKGKDSTELSWNRPRLIQLDIVYASFTRQFATVWLVRSESLRTLALSVTHTPIYLTLLNCSNESRKLNNDSEFQWTVQHLLTTIQVFRQTKHSFLKPSSLLFYFMYYNRHKPVTKHHIW